MTPLPPPPAPDLAAYLATLIEGQSDGEYRPVRVRELRSLLTRAEQAAGLTEEVDALRQLTGRQVAKLATYAARADRLAAALRELDGAAVTWDIHGFKGERDYIRRDDGQRINFVIFDADAALAPTPWATGTSPPSPASP